MKKLLVLAALSAMVMGAKAEMFEGVRFDVRFDGVSNYEDYKVLYVLSVSDYATWSANSLGSTLADASWMNVPYDFEWYGNRVFSSYNVTVDGERSGLSNIARDEEVHDLPMYIVLTDGEGYYAKELSASVSYAPHIPGFSFFAPEFKVSGAATPFGSAEPVPEPTSGLLLLLGVAGLALKRKRA